jgi:hypothetical protein
MPPGRPPYGEHKRSPAHALPVDRDDRAERLLRMQKAAADIFSLMNAAEALNRRANETD